MSARRFPVSLFAALFLSSCGLDASGLEALNGNWLFSLHSGMSEEPEKLPVWIEVSAASVTFTRIVDGVPQEEAGRWAGTIEGNIESFLIEISRPDPVDLEAPKPCFLMQNDERYDGSGGDGLLQGLYASTLRWSGKDCSEGLPVIDPTPVIGSFTASSLSSVASAATQSP